MPNHCTNYLSCTSGKNIGELIKPYISYKEQHGQTHPFLDFNKIIPMPEGILKTCDSSTIEEITKQRTPEEVEARQKEHDALCEQNQIDYGYKNWYDWSVAVWDTKWNSYSNITLEEMGSEDKIEDIESVTFQTAWSPPINVIRKLAQLVGASLRMSYYDEGWMFAGEYLVNADGSETDDCYDDMDEIEEDSELWHECDLGYYYELKDEEDEE